MQKIGSWFISFFFFWCTERERRVRGGRVVSSGNETRESWYKYDPGLESLMLRAGENSLASTALSGAVMVRGLYHCGETSARGIRSTQMIPSVGER